jgi:hypothetical protein
MYSVYTSQVIVVLIMLGDGWPDGGQKSNLLVQQYSAAWFSCGNWHFEVGIADPRIPPRTPNVICVSKVWDCTENEYQYSW